MTDPNEDLTLAARGLCKQRNNRAHWNAIDRGECNSDILAQARANVAEKNNPAHRRAILEGQWDVGELIKREVERLLKNPPIVEGQGDA